MGNERGCVEERILERGGVGQGADVTLGDDSAMGLCNHEGCHYIGEGKVAGERRWGVLQWRD